MGVDIEYAIIIDGYTALIIASKNGHKGIVQILLDKKANKNVINFEGNTALIFASKNGHKEIVKMLLDKEADKNVKNYKGNTALIFASKNGHKEIVKMLLDKKADKNVKNVDGDTALIFASKNGHGEIVKMLLLLGVESEDYKNALKKAIIRGDYYMVNILFDKINNYNYYNEATMETMSNIASVLGLIDILNLISINKNPRKGQKWTDKEKEQLKNEVRNGLKIEEIAKYHGRSFNSIKSTIEIMGIEILFPMFLEKDYGKAWSRKEEKQLKNEVRNGLKIEEIAKLHKRTIGAIKTRIYKLGLNIL